LSIADFNLKGNWIAATLITSQTLESREMRLQGKDRELLLVLLRKILKWLPEERPSAEDLFEDGFILQFMPGDVRNFPVISRWQLHQSQQLNHQNASLSLALEAASKKHGMPSANYTPRPCKHTSCQTLKCPQTPRGSGPESDRSQIDTTSPDRGGQGIQPRPSR
jgi:hypothetical protein